MIKKALLTGACITLFVLLGLFVYGGDGGSSAIDLDNLKEVAPEGVKEDAGDYADAQEEINKLYEDNPDNPDDWEDADDLENLVELSQERDRAYKNMLEGAEDFDPREHGEHPPGYVDVDPGAEPGDVVTELEEFLDEEPDREETFASGEDSDPEPSSYPDEEPEFEEFLPSEGYKHARPNFDADYIEDYLECDETEHPGAAEDFIDFVDEADSDDLQNFIFADSDDPQSQVGGDAVERARMVRTVADDDHLGIELDDELVVEMDMVQFVERDARWMEAWLASDPVVIDEEDGTATLREFEAEFDDENVELDDFEVDLGHEDGVMYGESFSMNLEGEDEGVKITSRFTDDGEVEIISVDGEQVDEDSFDDLDISEEEVEEIVEEGTREADERLREEEQFTKSDPIQRHRNEMRHKFDHAGRQEVLDIFTSWTEKWLGDFSMQLFAEICGDTIHVSDERDTRHEGILGGLRAPGSEYESELEEKATGRDRPTVKLAGEKNQVGENLYRYGANMKLIGNQYDEWAIYLYNSCTEENSYDDYIESDAEYGWLDDGSISLHQYINQHYAGHRGVDMIFDCEDENCRFDQVCIVFEETNIPGASSDNKRPEELDFDSEPYCVTLAYGDGFFTEGETGSYNC